MFSHIQFGGLLFRLFAGGIVFCLVVAIAGVTFVEIARSRPVAMPNPTGPYAIGRTVYDWTDDAREDSLAPNSSSKRELLIWIWYPAVASTGASAAQYLPDDWGRALEQVHGLIGSQLFQRLDTIRVHAVADAPLSTVEPHYPVLLLLPGFGNVAPYYTALAEDLASQGYVVVGITPTYTTTVVFPDGRKTERTSAGSIPESNDSAALESAGDRLVSVWTADARFVLDRLTYLNAEQGDRFAGRLDLARVGILGHSFGGATAAEVCHLDNRFKAGVDLDGNLFGDVPQAGLGQPFMFLLSESPSPTSLDQQAEGVPQSDSGDHPNGRYILTIKGTKHFNFTDYSLQFNLVLKAFGMIGEIDGQRGLEITSKYVSEFFDHYLRDQSAPLLQGPSPLFPEVTGHFEGDS